MCSLEKLSVFQAILPPSPAMWVTYSLYFNMVGLISENKKMLYKIAKECLLALHIYLIIHFYIYTDMHAHMHVYELQIYSYACICILKCFYADSYIYENHYCNWDNFFFILLNSSLRKIKYKYDLL